MNKKITASILMTALLSFYACAGVSADDEADFAADQKIISVIGGKGPVWVTILDEKHYNAEEEGYDRLIIDEECLPFVDENGRTQMPLRAVSEELDFKVDWNEAEKKITLEKAGQTVIFHIGDDKFSVNDKLLEMDTVPALVNDYTFIPLRYLGEAVGYTVEYTDRNLVSD